MVRSKLLVAVACSLFKWSVLLLFTRGAEEKLWKKSSGKEEKQLISYASWCVLVLSFQFVGEKKFFFFFFIVITFT
jgi:hypothetical protein